MFIAVLAFAILQAPPQEWEGRELSDLLGQGFVRESKSHHLGLTGIKKGQPMTTEKKDRAIKELFKTLKFNDVQIKVEPDPANPGKVVATVIVGEYPVVESVEFRGLNEIPLNQLKPNLRLSSGEPLNPFALKQDREYIREQYLGKGYHFSSIEDSTRPGAAGGVILAWTITEGPLVSVDRIILAGTLTVDKSDLERFMLSKENGRLLGLIPTGKEPFVERNLREDIERIKLYYRLEGWLDIQDGDHVFIKDLQFNEDKTTVVVTIHIEEGSRYTIRNVKFEFDPAGQSLFPEEEMRSWLVSRPGDPYTENNAGKDAQKIREKYGERAYIQAEVSHNEIVSLTSRELDLVYAIKENDKIHVARLIFEGNTKTREEVLRREFTRTGFMPGEEYNSRNLQRAIQRIKDRGWVEAQGGIAVRTQETEEPQGRDVVIDVREGQTGTVRLAAGFSSSFGILGLLEFTQRNFDIADLPSSFEDLVNGTGFAGGGQFLRLRLAPAARRQSYTADFREPYVFGHEFGMDIRGYATNTFRESYNDRRVGAAISFDKRFEPLTAQITLNGYRVDIDDVEIGAPRAVQELKGSNTVFSLVPALIYDSRDSFIFPTEGLRFLLSEEYAGQILPGDFDFHKLLFEAEGHVTLYETEGHLRHVGSVAFTFGWAHAARRVDTVPLIERFYAGGRDSIRGFEFRGVGPREQGDPVGGEAYVLGTIEYSYPLFVEFLRGAFFYDIANLSSRIENLNHDKWRNTVGFGIRFLIPQLANIPVKLDFGFPLTKEDDDERQTVTFDIGALF